MIALPKLQSGHNIADFHRNTGLCGGRERKTMFEDYFEKMSVKRLYPMGIHIVVYALTH